ncbi:acyl-CoA N-acyltransferase [Ascodesmis nigricans]|uniref:Acyl-CoA N-acyltransferase n=1 Tax=Ascodesmis nigricans TaxID=341454 RepID=A0A4S2MIS9_9PEZI|nr:acyl-CoA N-acyltransferase [Ascodesmis nigricans]
MSPRRFRPLTRILRPSPTRRLLTTPSKYPTFSSPSGLSYHIRPARHQDAPRLCDIFTHYVRNSAVTLDLAPPDLKFHQDAIAAGARDALPVLVAAGKADDKAGDDDVVIGYRATRFLFPGRVGWSRTVTGSTYIDRDYLHRGIGSRLITEVMRMLRERAAVSHPTVVPEHVDDVEKKLLVQMGWANDERWYRRQGYERVGRVRNAGWKFGRDWDVVWWQRSVKLGEGEGK